MPDPTNARPQSLRQIYGIDRPAPNLAEATLILIDEQNDYTAGPLLLAGIDTARAANARLLAAARAAGGAIVHIAQIGRPGGLFDRAGPGGAFIAEVAPLPGEVVIEKRYASAFAGTALAEVLAGLGTKTLVLAGYMIHNCVAATAFDAVVHDFSVAIVADATASRDLPDGRGGIVRGEDIHRAALAGLSDRQADIVSLDDILAASAIA